MKRPFLITACCLLIAVFTFDSCKKEEDEFPPVINSITPDRGPVGTSVTITGDNFTTDASVYFNGAEGVVTSATKKEIVVTVPANATSGALSVTSNNRSGVGPDFTVEFPPAITSITPATGKAGDQVTISGNNFSTVLAQNLVKFNGVTATVNTASAAQLGVVVPTGVTTGAITVEVKGLLGTGPVFSVIPPPAITSITPLTGKVGDVVTIAGTNFSTTASENSVKFNGTSAIVTSATATQLVTAVPAGATSGAITVTTNAMTATGSAFTIIPPPTITTINPVSGLAGSTVTITGTNFSSTAASNTVKFNGTSATVSTASSTELAVVVPASATSGAVTVEVNGMLATGPTFTVVPPVTITSISPTSGTTCSTSVTITGTNFSATPADNVVKINGVSVTVSSASSTQLVVSVAGAVTTGALTVTTASQVATGPTFTVTPNEATMTMDAIDYTYSGFCPFVVSGRYWITASGGFTSPKPSWVIQFAGLRPTTAGAYPADISAERPGETWDFTPATVDVSFDAQGRMVVTFANVLLTPRGGTAPKLFSGTAKVY